MKTQIKSLGLDGPLALTAFKAKDKRGCMEKYFEEELCKNLNMHVKEVLLSRNTMGVVRGLHYQAIKPQAKIVWCVKGRIFDVIVDLRVGSGTFGKWTGIVLSAEKGEGVFVPKGFAHGFASMEDGSEVLYLLGRKQEPKLERGLRFDDKKLAIKWPLDLKKAIVSQRDRVWPGIAKAGSP